MNSVDLAFTPALEQARLIRDRQVSPLELVELYLRRIEQLDGKLGSYWTVMTETAIAEAKAKTEQLSRPTNTLPPFFGVPISIKDLTAVEGVPCSYGVAALREQPAPYDEGIVTRLRLAGFTILGKTATSELGSMPFTEPEGFAPTRNPWNLDYTPGGSSGGAAAAVAAGLCAIAQGSDGGGSIRGPAACCGLVGLKPSRGRVSYAPVGDRLNGLATKGALARTVSDAAAILDVLSGYLTGDPYWLPDPNPAFLTASQQPVPRLRIAFSTGLPPLGTADSSCQQAVLNTVKLLEAWGHHLEPGCPDCSDLVEPFTTIWQSAVPAAGVPREFLGKMNRWLFDRTVNAGEYLQAVSQMQVIARRIVSFWDTVDVLVLPVYLHSPIQVGAWADLDPAATLENVIRWVAPCAPFNATGQPAIAVPVGFDAQGLPMSVQLVARPAQESILLALAAQIEAANGDRLRRPAIAQTS